MTYHATENPSRNPGIKHHGPYHGYHAPHLSRSTPLLYGGGGRVENEKGLTMKTTLEHNCNRKHQNARTFLNCAVPENVWITGRGDYALIAWCEHVTVSLWSTAEDAEKKKAFIDKTRCGGRCINHHEIVRVEVAA